LRLFKLTLACKHTLDVPAVEQYDGKVYNPNFVGRSVKCRHCGTPQKVTAQDPPFAADLPAEQAGPMLVDALKG
jgi:hypothetical protein